MYKVTFEIVVDLKPNTKLSDIEALYEQLEFNICNYYHVIGNEMKMIVE